MLSLLTLLMPDALNTVSKFVVNKDQRIKINAELTKIFVRSINSAREHDKASYGILFVDIIRGLIRPVITAFAFAIWAVSVLNTEIVLEPEDRAIVAVIMAFWFGGRFLGKDIQK